MELLNSQLLALLVAAALLFGNELLVQHLLVTQLVAIKRLGTHGSTKIGAPWMWKCHEIPYQKIMVGGVILILGLGRD